MRIFQALIQKLAGPTHETKAYDVPYQRHRPEYVIASWFWSGRLRPAAGTWGTLAALPFWYVVFLLGSFKLVLGIMLLLLVLGAVAIDRIEGKVGKKKYHDASVFVVDEVLGVGIALLPVAYFGTALLPVWAWWVLAFLVFRFFDVVKIFPARLIDRKMHSGWGVMLDDVVAGLQAAVVMLTLLQTVATWGACMALGKCMGTDGELLFLLGLHAAPVALFFALCILVPWGVGRLRKF